MNKIIQITLTLIFISIILFLIENYFFKKRFKYENFSNNKLKILVVQADNRESLDYLILSKKLNKKFSKYLNYDYEFIKIDDKKYKNLHPATMKIYIVNDIIQNYNYDILVFLDSDAWIQNPLLLNKMILNLIENKNKNGCFSRDPYVKKNTYINSGSFILKINEYTKKMYSDIINDMEKKDYSHKKKWPYDQYYISNYIYKNNNDFYIFIPDIINTPKGKILRHNWIKSKQMFSDLNSLLKVKDYENTFNDDFDITKILDNKPFPNKNVKGYEYMD